MHMDSQAHPITCGAEEDEDTPFYDSYEDEYDEDGESENEESNSMVVNDDGTDDDVVQSPPSLHSGFK